MGCHGGRALTIPSPSHGVLRRRRTGLPRGRDGRRGPRGGHDRGPALCGRARGLEPGGLAGSVACLLPSGRWRACRACSAALRPSVALVACLEPCRPVSPLPCRLRGGGLLLPRLRAAPLPSRGLALPRLRRAPRRRPPSPRRPSRSGCRARERPWPSRTV